jgi:predicted regulator of Ras-like GTPase activity (Roadblock/LC7/MglB family)
MLALMDANQAIADVTEISPQVRHVAVLGADGAVVGSNAPSDEAARIADCALRLLQEADALRAERGLGAVAQIEAATISGSVFVVRDGEHTIAATTTPEPTVGLVFYDLKTCLRSVDFPKPARRAPRKKSTDDAAA